MRLLTIWMILLSFVSEAIAEETSGNWGYSGRYRAIDRHEEKDGRDSHSLRGQFRLDAWVNLNDSGCVKIRTRITTGDSYNSESAISSAFDGKSSADLSIRRLYVDVRCLNENYRIEAGAMPARTEGRLGLTDYGWVDGVRVVIDDRKNGRLLYFTVGEINNLRTPNVFKRKHSGRNYTQAELSQIFGDDNSILVSLSEYDDTVYTRIALRLAMKQYVQWMDSVATESLFSGSQKAGTQTEALFKIKDWKLIAYRTTIAKNLPEEEKIDLLFKNFFGYGTNYYFEAEKSFGQNKQWTFGMRLRDGDAGYLIETGFTRRFGNQYAAIPVICCPSTRR